MNIAADNWLPRHRIDVDAFHRMAEAGILAADARVELIQGEMLDLAPIGNTHIAIVNRLNLGLIEAIGRRAVVGVQQPLRLDRYSEPQPDIAVFKPRADFYEGRAAAAADALLVIEVCDTSLRYDREIKAPLYAQHGVPELWLIDAQLKRLTRMWEPVNGRYSKSTVMSEGMLQVGALADVTVDVRWLLGQ